MKKLLLLLLLAATALPARGAEMRYTIDMSLHDGFTVRRPEAKRLDEVYWVYNLPLWGTTGNYTLTIDWGDGSEPRVIPPDTEITTDYYSSGALQNHWYFERKTYVVTITSSQEDFTREQIPHLDFQWNDDVLVSLDTPLLCVPSQMGMELCFANCKNLLTIPTDLFVNNTDVTNFNRCFLGCTALRSIPAGLFARNLEATDFSECFMYCEQATIDPDIFCDETTEKQTRFAGRKMDFTRCFLGVQGGGEAPALWSYAMHKESFHAHCFYRCEAANSARIPPAWRQRYTPPIYLI